MSEIVIKCPHCKWESKMKMENMDLKKCPVCKVSVTNENKNSSNKTILKDQMDLIGKALLRG